jgi:hypothetical protein
MTKLTKITALMILVLALGFTTPSVKAGTGYVDPEDTSINMDISMIIGGAAWLSGIVFFTSGKYLRKNFSNKKIRILT